MKITRTFSYFGTFTNFVSLSGLKFSFLWLFRLLSFCTLVHSQILLVYLVWSSHFCDYSDCCLFGWAQIDVSRFSRKNIAPVFKVQVKRRAVCNGINSVYPFLEKVLLQATKRKRLLNLICVWPCIINVGKVISKNQLDATITIYWSPRLAQHVLGNLLPIFRSVRLRFSQHMV